MIQVVDRIGHVLDAFARRGSELTLSECAAETGLTKSTTHRLLSSLEAIGLVERSERSWRLGARVVTLAATRLGELDLRDEALVLLREIAAAEHASAGLAVPEGGEMVYVDRVTGPGPLGVGPRLGGRSPLWASAAGRAYLARLEPDAAARRIDDAGFRALPAGVRERIRADVATARDRGYCVDDGLSHDGISSVCIAVCDLADRPIAVLGVMVPSDRVAAGDIERIAARLLDARAQLEVLLGLRDQLTG